MKSKKRVISNIAKFDNMDPLYSDIDNKKKDFRSRGNINK